MGDPVNDGVGRVAMLLSLVVVVAAGVFVQRGVVRGVTGSHDLTMMYAGARQWVQGGNPYPLDVAYDAYLEGGGGAERPRDPKWFAQLYPPTTYAVMAPVGALRWSVARGVFCGLNLVGWGLAGWWAWGAAPRCGEGLGFRVWGLGKRGTQAWGVDRGAIQGSAGASPSRAAAGLLVVAGFLAWSPMHTTLGFGQLGGVVVGLVCLGIGRPDAKRSRLQGTGTFFGSAKNVPVPVWRATAAPALRGLALAVACCLKPQLAGLFVVVLAAAGRWRTVAWTCGWGLLISAVAVGRLMATAPTWWGDLRANLAAFAGTGFADPSRANEHAWQMINLEPWLRHVGVGEALAGVLPWVIGLAALVIVGFSGASTLFRFEKRGLSPSSSSSSSDGDADADALLHLLAAAAVVSLLVVYHRSYDAVLLVFPAVWAWRRVRACGWRGAGGLAAGLVAVMGLPLPAVLSVAADRGWLPGGLAETAWWVPGVLMHQNVALVVLLGVLCAGGGRVAARV